ncbi:MAG: leucine--tRNA ligase [Actinobacteria bacterium]|nr:MAG: leucine--tRNA ligase [Actinomycetota bacterium]
MEKYDPQAIETKWQRAWEEARAFNTPNTGDADGRDFYLLEMLPYPSGTLHVGQVRNYTQGDVLTHFRRRTGRRVLRPMGYDSFGLNAENAAIRDGGRPREIVEQNIKKIRAQMKRMGWAIDWDRQVASHEPAYYHWTQRLFLQFLNAGQAYRKEAPVKWCPKDQTVLANEQVINGRCERCGTVVESKSLEQWFFRYTTYADELLDEMELLESWPERVLAMQRNWIGRSEGAEILFRVEELDLDIPVFTTRADTLYGATFFVLAPEHSLIAKLVEGTPQQGEVLDYVRRSAARTFVEREEKEKDGVFTGRYAVNPVNDERLPIWVADYVLMEYGSGAIMAVPAHDERDYEFARKYELPVQPVVVPLDGTEPELPYVAKSDDAKLANSGQFSGLPAPEGERAIVAWLGGHARGRPAVSYRLRDWLISRQRYWGSPIPVVHCERCGIVPVPEDELPVLLPEIEDYTPKGKSPLEAAEDWIRVPCPQCGGEGRREADTMDTFVDSSWYFLRYCDPRNDRAAFEPAVVNEWCPVDQYIGGLEHAVMHLLYARYFIKVLNDLGLVDFREPFTRLYNHGWVDMGGAKMSKSKGNVVSPDELVARHSADALRLHILFIGPADARVDWQENGLEGMSRFLRRLWRLGLEVATQPPALAEGALAHKATETIVKVTDDFERRYAYNTAIAAVMELVNDVADDPSAPGARFAVETAVSLIQPAAPHIAEELWERLGHGRLWEEPWPVADPALLQRETFELVVQVNGKVRDRLEVPADLPEDELIARAKESPKVQAHLNGGEIRQTIVVPRKLVNLVVG